MKHLHRSRPRLRRWLLATTSVTLAVSGGTAGHHLAATHRSPAPVEQTAVAAPAPTRAAAPTPAARRPAPTTTAPTTPAPRATPTTRAPAPSTVAPAPAPVVPSTAAPTSSTPAPVAPTAAPPAGSTDDPLAGLSLYAAGPSAAAAAAVQAAGGTDAALLTELAGVPTATWFGSWNSDVTQAVRSVVTAAASSGTVPVLVAYDVPGTDCGGYSAGGAPSPAEYGDWVQDLADGIGTAEAIVVVEPDALAQLCGDPAARYAMLDSAIDVLETNPGTHTYLDAGNPTWIGAQEMAGRLRAAGVADADGFALNVSNFETTASNVAYGRTVSAALGGAHFVIDTSRNGNGPGNDWCNPGGRAVGERPTTRTGQAGVDAYLWVKRPGESDGTCNGGPAAGVFWPEYALGLMRAG